MEKQDQKVELVETVDVAASVRDPLVGSVFAGRYAVQSIIGHGATSSVYLALDQTKNQVVAIKILHLHLASDASLVGRFKREAKTASILQHPNIVAVHEYGVSADGLPYLVMDFVEGTSLQELLRKKESLAPGEALPVFKQICAALIAAHEKGVVHRDIKPGNIMLGKSTDGGILVKVLDFGCAQVLPVIGDTVLKLTQTGEMLCSLLYMSPEQCLDQDVDERSDCYSLGCLMYETLTGKPPLAARTAFETMNKQISEMPLPFSMVRPDLALPFPLQEIVFKSMAKSPENRYPSILDLLSDLDRLRVGPGELQSIAVQSSPEPAVDSSSSSSSSSSSESLTEYLRQAALELPPAPGIAHAETENVIRRSFVALFFVVVFPLVFFIATSIGLVSSFGALLFLSVFFVVFGFGWVIRAELRDASRNFSLPSAEAVLKARKHVSVVVVAAYAISQQRIILEVSRFQNSGGTEGFKSELVVQPAENSEKFWVQLARTGGSGQFVSILPITAYTVIDGDDRVLALVIGRHVAWVVS